MGKISKNKEILIENSRKGKLWGAKKILNIFLLNGGLLVDIRTWSDGLIQKRARMQNRQIDIGNTSQIIKLRSIVRQYVITAVLSHIWCY